MAEPIAFGRFTVVERLGGTDDIYLVVDPRDGEPRALHVVPILEPEWGDILRRDLSALIHEPITEVVTVYEFDLQPDRALIVTEPLAHPFDPASYPAPGGAIDRAEALAVAALYGRGVAALRQRSISCVAVTPNSLCRTVSGAIKIARVGARPVAAGRTTQAGLSTIADIQYLPPETIAGRAEPSQDATDVFAAGVLLYQLLTHHRPFAGESPFEYATAVVNRRRDERLRADDAADRPIMALVERALSHDARERPTLDVFARELNRLIAAPPDEPVFDENVQFTVYRPLRIAAGEWEPLLVFAHLSERRGDTPEEPDPVEEVRRQAEAILGAEGHSQQTVDSSQSVPRQGEITFIPHANGVEFDPPVRRFRWTNPVHREEFLLRAAGATAGATFRGRVTVYLGTIILAEIPLTLTVGNASTTGRSELTPQWARPYRRIFASYSHRDRAVVEEFAAYARAVGDRYQMDVVDLRSGESWQPALESLIREADVFQLFWSWNAIESPYVRREWEYALQLGRPSFVRPVYWDDPMPRRGDMPPSALLDLHFESVRPHAAVTAPPASAAPVQPSEVPPATYGAPQPSMPPPAPARFRSWRTATAAAAVLLAVVMLPTLYFGTRLSGPAPDGGLPTPTPASSLTVVVRSDDGQVRANAEVELLEPVSGRVLSVARTDASGRVVFHDVKREAYEIRTKDATSEAKQRVLVTREPAVLDLVVRPAPRSVRPLPQQPINAK